MYVTSKRSKKHTKAYLAARHCNEPHGGGSSGSSAAATVDDTNRDTNFFDDIFDELPNAATGSQQAEFYPACDAAATPPTTTTPASSGAAASASATLAFGTATATATAGDAPSVASGARLNTGAISLGRLLRPFRENLAADEEEGRGVKKARNKVVVGGGGGGRGRGGRGGKGGRRDGSSGGGGGGGGGAGPAFLELTDFEMEQAGPGVVRLTDAFLDVVCERLRKEG